MKTGIILLAISIGIALAFTPILSDAHQSGCHRWHSCPSDTGSYVCGDLGYDTYCPKSSPKTEPKEEPSKEKKSYTLKEALESQNRTLTAAVENTYPRELTAHDVQCMKKSGDAIVAGKILSPKWQVFCGTVPDKIICDKSLQLIFKPNDNTPVCVTEKTLQTLIKRGWSLFIDPSCQGVAQCFTGTVDKITDGDTIRVNDFPIRFALSSAPELNEVNGQEARDFIANLCPVGSRAIVDEDDIQTGGSYGRIIGVIYCNGVNLNEKLAESEFGIISKGFCDKSEFSGEDWAVKYGCNTIEAPNDIPTVIPKTSNIPKENCDSSYPTVCIAPYPPDLNCGDIPYKRFTVLPPDPHRFDGDKDGIGCES